jgi:cyclase
MHKKRIIFSLLFNNGNFALSRNFNLQNVGDLNWLQNNYNFGKISFSIDELILLDVSRDNRSLKKFSDTLKKITEGCFVPICAGGGLKHISDVNTLLRSGADKVIVNTSLFENKAFIQEIADLYGEQCIVASFDLKKNTSNQYELWSSNGRRLEGLAKEYLDRLDNFPVGEVYLNSIDQDGTGNGYDLDILNILPSGMNKPVVFAGGVGNSKHLAAGLSDPRIDAVATAHLFNFIGDGLKKARSDLIEIGYDLPIWDGYVADKLSGHNVETKFD